VGLGLLLDAPRELEAKRVVGIALPVEPALLGRDDVVHGREDARELHLARVVAERAKRAAVGHARTGSRAAAIAAAERAPSRSTSGRAPVASTTLLGCAPPASTPATSANSPAVQRSASARVRQSGAPLRFRLVAVSGPTPRRPASEASAKA